jgi:hypothetical protein
VLFNFGIQANLMQSYGPCGAMLAPYLIGISIDLPVTRSIGQNVWIGTLCPQSAVGVVGDVVV